LKELNDRRSHRLICVQGLAVNINKKMCPMAHVLFIVVMATQLQFNVARQICSLDVT
jgi:hypothetical protein